MIVHNEQILCLCDLTLQSVTEMLYFANCAASVLVLTVWVGVGLLQSYDMNINSSLKSLNHQLKKFTL